VTTTEDPSGKELEVRPDAEVSEVVDAELVEQLPLGRPEPPTLIGTIVEHPVQTVVHAVIVIRESPKVRKAVTPVRVTARAGYTTGQGFAWWWRRAVDAATHGKLRRAEEAAEAANDAEALLKARAALETARNNRQARIMRLPLILGACAAVTLGIVLLIGLALLIGGILVWAFDGNCTPTSPPDCGGITWTSWWDGVADFWDAVGTWGRRLITWALWAAGPVIVWAAWREGDRRGNRPRWATTADERAELDSVIDERMVSLALANLGIAPLTQFFKDGGQLTYLVIPRKDGEGTFTRVRLCLGVTVEMVNRYRPKLAGNLNRAPLEVWPTEHDEASILDLWIADKGKLNAGAGPWPLLDDGTVDVFEGVPFGRSQRGEVILAPLFAANWLIGGRPGQGKSAAMRTLMLGAALDPTVEMWAFILGESPDFDPFRPRLTRYAMGLDDDVFEAAIQGLRDLLAELERRGKVLGSQGQPKTSRKLANNSALGLHLIVATFDEVHELFMHPEYGKEAADLAVRLIRRGRKYGIVLIFATQAPTADSIPRDVTRNTSCGVAFSVQDHVANDGLLGTGKYKAGIRATELRFNVDRGTCVTVGVTDNSFELIRTFYIPFGDGQDQVTPVINRAMEGIRELRRTAEPKVLEPVVPDHLRAVWDVLTEVREEIRDVLPKLRQRWPETYQGWTQARLIEELEDVWGVTVGTLKGYRVLLAADVEAALEARENDHGGNDDEEA
jgi:S-DNA-T family DNA segregation ATPase FtsK/SpoIIIE